MLRLRLVLAAPALAALATAAGLLWLALTALLEHTMTRQLLDEVRILVPIVAARSDLDTGSAELESWTQGLVAESSARLTLIRADGTVIADSAVDAARLPSLENHRQRPEVVQALLHGEGAAVRPSATVQHKLVYAAGAFTDARGHRLVLRLAQPIEELQRLHVPLLDAFLPALAAALAVIALSALWIDRRFLRPLLALTQDAGQLAAGDYGRRIALPDDERLLSLAQALQRLAGRVREEIGTAEAERDHLRTILSRMSDGVLVLQADGRVLLANPAFRQLFGVEGEVAGRGPLEVVRQPELARLVQRTLESGQGQTVDVAVELPKHRTLSLASTSLGAGQGAVIVARDTSEQERLNQMRRDFVANVSHELKTPLAAIRGFSETLRDGALDDPVTARRFTERILVQCRRLQAILDDLLTLSRLESVGKATLRFEKVELVPIVERSAEMVGLRARERSVQVHLELAAGLPAIAAHAESLERLVVNLLDNAVKYNREGGEVRVRLEARGGQLVLEVADRGIGIPAASLPRLFERFYRVDQGRSREEGGTGLGLSIVKHVAQLHGGRVEVESIEGQGATFRVWLPLAGASGAVAG